MIPLRIMETCDTLVGNVKDNSNIRTKSDSASGQSRKQANDNTNHNKSSKSIDTKTGSDKQTSLQSSSLATKESRVETELDDVPVEACLEYLTRPHTSWKSVVKLHEQRKARITNHSLSVYSRSKAATRRSSFASQLSLDTSNYSNANKGKINNISSGSNSCCDALWNSFASFQSVNSACASDFDGKHQRDMASCASSVCTAPVQVNNNNSKNKSSKGKLCRGRRMLPTTSTNTTTAASFSSSSHFSSSSCFSPTTAALSVNGAKMTKTPLPLESSTSLTVTGLTARNGKLQNHDNLENHLQTSINDNNNSKNISFTVSNSMHENGNKTSREATGTKPQHKHGNSSKPQLKKPGVLRSSSYLPPLPPSRS